VPKSSIDSSTPRSRSRLTISRTRVRSACIADSVTSTTNRPGATPLEASSDMRSRVGSPSISAAVARLTESASGLPFQEYSGRLAKASAWVSTCSVMPYTRPELSARATNRPGGTMPRTG
jgi:hypothetical protein